MFQILLCLSIVAVNLFCLGSFKLSDELRCLDFYLIFLQGSIYLYNKRCFFYTFLRLAFELCIGYCTHRVISDKVHRLLVTLSYFRPDRFVQLLSLIPILILLLYLLVSIDLVYTGLSELVPE